MSINSGNTEMVLAKTLIDNQQEYHKLNDAAKILIPMLYKTKEEAKSLIKALANEVKESDDASYSFNQLVNIKF